ncbi:hypothetical protein [Mycobacterium intracellulare]|uniref:hypothetical protein n=1 Tax=Mycobacterium intracellulare TaxID=1767 RepID=UPI003BB5C716
MQHDYRGTEHFLLGLLASRHGGRSCAGGAGRFRGLGAPRSDGPRSSSAASCGQPLSLVSSASDRNRTGMTHAIRADQCWTRLTVSGAGDRPQGERRVASRAGHR